MTIEVPAGIDYQALLAELKAKRDALNQTIQGLEKFVGGASAPASRIAQAARIEQASADRDESKAAELSSRAAGKAKEAGVGVISQQFRNMTILQAASAYLRAVGGGKTTEEVAKAVELGGFKHRSTDFVNNVRSVLSRNAKAGREVRKAGKGTWAAL